MAGDKGNEVVRVIETERSYLLYRGRESLERIIKVVDVAGWKCKRNNNVVRQTTVSILT